MKRGTSSPVLILDDGILGGLFNGLSHAAPLGRFGLASTKSTEFNDALSWRSAVAIVICDSDRTAVARDIEGSDVVKEGLGEKTGCARASDGTGDKIDEIDTVESERKGAPNRNGGRDIWDILEPMESDRMGAALPKLGKEMTDKFSLAIEVADSSRDKASFPPSLANTM